MAASMRSVLTCLTLRLAKQQLKTCSRNYSIYPPTWLGGFPHKRFEEGMGGHPWPEETLEDRLAAEKAASGIEDREEVLDIGLEHVPSSITKEDTEISRESRKTKESAARHRTLLIPLDDVVDRWETEEGPEQIEDVADHYGIYEHLFNGAIFTPVLPLSISYNYDEELVTPVYRGNEIKPSDAQKEPNVVYEAEDDSLWTLIMTNPDGHLTDNEAEYIHWFVGNIPGNDISKGEELVRYLQPFPPRGTGFHRHVFILYKQGGKVDYSSIVPEQNEISLANRTFKTVEFFRKYSEQLTPVGLSFFQSEWDSSVQDVYHHTLNMREPAFEYAYAPYYHPPKVAYPHRQPFDRYWDRYRDKKDLAEEVMKMKMEMISPLKPYERQFQFPIAKRPREYKPSWLRERDEKKEKRLEQFRDLP